MKIRIYRVEYFRNNSRYWYNVAKSISIAQRRFLFISKNYYKESSIIILKFSSFYSSIRCKLSSAFFLPFFLFAGENKNIAKYSRDSTRFFLWISTNVVMNFSNAKHIYNSCHNTRCCLHWRINTKKERLMRDKKKIIISEAKKYPLICRFHRSIQKFFFSYLFPLMINLSRH